MIETPDPKVSLTSPCPCGSGRKYKRCCWPVEKRRVAEARTAIRESNALLGEYALRFEDEIAEFQELFFGPAQKRFGQEMLSELLSQTGEMVQVAFMDMLIADHVMHCGWTVIDEFLDDGEASGGLHPAAREYIKNWGEASIGLYEVQSVIPGESLVLKNLFSRRSVEVSERTASQSLGQWDTLFTRVVLVGETGILTGPVLPVPRRKLDWLIDNVTRLKERPGDRTVTWSRYFKKHWPDIPFAWFSMWVAPFEGLQLRNFDDEELSDIEVRYALKTDGGREAATRLDQMQELEHHDGESWTWVVERDRGTMETVSIAFVSLDGDWLSVRVNSQEREVRVRERVDAVLGELVRSVQRKEEAVDVEAMGDRATSRNFRDESNSIPIDVQRPIIHEMLTKHYRRWLDEPVPALDGLTPRQAAKDRGMRPRLVALLKSIEVEGRRRGPDDPAAEFDFGWLWRELSIR